MAGVAGATFQDDLLYRFGGGDPRITIAVLDGPVDRTHDCFRGARLTPLDTAPAARSDDRATAQGTHVASLIFGQPCSSVEGIAPLCRGLIAPIFASQSTRCAAPDLARAILLALAHGADIIDVSAGWNQLGAGDPHLRKAIAACSRRNVLIVAAADNDDFDGFVHIAAAGMRSSMLLVGAIEDARPPAADSGGRSRYCRQEILAPGLNVTGAALQGGIAQRSGANCAAAMVAALAGLLLTAQLRHGLAPDPRAAAAAILQSALPRCRERWLTGSDQVAAAIELLTSGSGHARPSGRAMMTRMRSLPN